MRKPRKLRSGVNVTADKIWVEFDRVGRMVALDRLPVDQLLSRLRMSADAARLRRAANHIVWMLGLLEHAHSNKFKVEVYRPNLADPLEFVISMEERGGGKKKDEPPSDPAPNLYYEWLKTVEKEVAA